MTLVDAAELGEKTKDGKNQRTILSIEDELKIINAFSSNDAIDGFCAKVTIEQIRAKKYTWSIGQYFDIKIPFIELSGNEFEEKINQYSNDIEELFASGNSIQNTIQNNIKRLTRG